MKINEARILSYAFGCAILLGLFVLISLKAWHHRKFCIFTQTECSHDQKAMDIRRKVNRELLPKEDLVCRYIAIALLAGDTRDEWQHKKHTLIELRKIIREKIEDDRKYVDLFSSLIEDEIRTIDDILQGKDPFYESLRIHFTDQKTENPPSPIVQAEEYWEEVGILSLPLRDIAVDYMKKLYKDIPEKERSPSTLWDAVLKEKNIVKPQGS